MAWEVMDMGAYLHQETWEPLVWKPLISSWRWMPFNYYIMDMELFIMEMKPIIYIMDIIHQWCKGFVVTGRRIDDGGARARGARPNCPPRARASPVY